MSRVCAKCGSTETKKWRRRGSIYLPALATGFTDEDWFCHKCYHSAYQSHTRRQKYHSDPEFKRKHQERVRDASYRERINKHNRERYATDAEYRANRTFIPPEGHPGRQRYLEAKKRYRIKYAEKVREYKRIWHTEHRETAIKRMSDYRLTAVSQFSYAKSNAHRRKIEWQLTMEQYLTLRCMPCYYCGHELPNTGSCLDRLDSKGTYEESNLVACCPRCNYIKGDGFTPEETKVMVMAALNPNYEYTKIEYGLFVDTAQRDRAESRFLKMVLSAAKRKIPVSMTEDEYDALVKHNKCFYCSGALPTAGYGLDRTDSKGGYSFDNCVPCCPVCNSIKRNVLTVEQTLRAVNALQRLRMRQADEEV